MKYIENQLIKERENLERLIKNVKERLRNAPRGRLRICRKENRLEYYLKDEKENKNKNGKYIRKKDERLVQKLAQRDYDINLLEKAEEKVRAINVFLERYKKADISKVYEDTNEYRRRLLEDAIVSNEEYVKQWESVKYEGKGFSDSEIEIYTDKGERVRSKSEKIIADRLNVLGIPYRYEYPLLLNGNVKVYPDFTLLNIDTKEEVYLEHCGLMDDPAYVDILMYKLKTYERNGIYLGINLFMTFESGKYPLNGKVIDVLVKNLFYCTKSNVLLQ